MKNFFIAITLIFSLNASAQKSQVYTDSSQTREQVFFKTITWIAKTWGANSDKVIVSKDPATGIILVRGGLKAVPKNEGFAVKGITLTELKVTAENGKAMLNFDHTTFKWDAGTLWNFNDTDGGAQQATWKTDVLAEIDGLIASYKAEFESK